MANPNPTPKVENLTPWVPGQSGNPAGKKPGLKNWSTLVQDVLGDDELLPRLVKLLPKRKQPLWFDEIEDKRFGMAILVAMGLKAVGGDDKGATFLRKTGYGDKLDLMSGGERVKPVYVIDLSKDAITPTIPV